MDNRSDRMNAIIHSRTDELVALCKARRVLRLSVFGSAAGELFDANRSDADFLVEFQPMSPAQHADSYFGLLEDIERLLGMKVDLVEAGPIRNPYFRESVERSRVLLYDAA